MTVGTKHVIEADLNQSIIIDPLDVMVTLAADIVCDKCGNPAAMIGTGHRDTRCPPMEAKDPPPWFLCNSCYRTWLNWVLAAVAGGGLLQCNDCNAIFRTIDEFSVWRTV